MDKVLKQRLIGATILIALAVIFIPMFFDAPEDDRSGREMSIELPEAPTDRGQVRRMPLDPDQARRPPPESVTEPAPSVTEPYEPAPTGESIVADIESGLEPEPEFEPESEISIIEVPEEPAPVEPEPVEEPAAPSVAPPAPDTAVEAGEGWLVQVASFQSETTAGETVERLTGLGHTASVDPLVRGEMTLYRVVTGPYSSRADADRARGQIARTVTGIDPVVRSGSPSVSAGVAPVRDEYAVQLGSFASRSNADNLVAQLAGHDFQAFIHEDTSGARTIWRVRLGPFSSRAEAVQQLAEVGERAQLEGLVVSHP